MDNSLGLKPGHVVQIDPTTPDCFFPGCFMFVTEIKAWGAQGFVLMPQTREEAPSRAYFRALWEQMEFVGIAPWQPSNLAEETTQR